MKKDDRDIKEILEAYDVTVCAHSAAQLVGVDAKTVRPVCAGPRPGWRSVRCGGARHAG